MSSTELDITAVLEHYGAFVAVADTGWRAIKCPFHEDRMASASVNLELNGFRCHACGISGNSFTLIQKQEHLDYEATVEFIRTVLGQSVREVQRSAKRKPKRSTWRRTLFD